MAACFSLLVPRVIVHDQFFVFFAVGPASSWGAGARALILIHQATVMASVVYTTNSFLFRYVQLCRNQFFYLFFSPTPVLFVTTMNILLICNWVAMIYVTTWPRADFVDYADNYILENYGYMLTEVSMGFRLDHMSPGAFAFLIEAIILLLLLASLSAFCAVSINAYLKHNTISERARKVHRTMFLLLSFQILRSLSTIGCTNMIYTIVVCGLCAKISLHYSIALYLAEVR
ncbi:hypothetical protein Q1695_012398 [Nippostrongylus brasiliensis]|nr:hypothetical protein Q1695_012398 [Nippostrongylus brasiliensis]